MKKVLSVLLSVCIVVGVALPTNAFAADPVAEQSHTSAVCDRITGAADYLLAGVTSFGVMDAADFVTYLDSGADLSTYTDGFVQSVSDALAANDGVILGYDGKEDIGLYGAVITALNRLGYDGRNFNGCDLVAKMEALPANQISNPYYYRLAISAASPAFASTLAGQFIADYYTMGKGMNYWGYSCDNTATLLAAVAPCAAEYSAVVADAKAVIAKHTKAGGCFYSDTYNDLSADSTATAIMAYSAVGENAIATKLLGELINGFESDEKGVFIAFGDKNAYTTKGVLLALEYYRDCVLGSGYTDHCIVTSATKASTSARKNGSVVSKCTVCGVVTKNQTINYASSAALKSTTFVYSGKAISPAVTVKDSKGKTIAASNYTVKYSSNKSVGTATATITMRGNYSGTIKKTYKINPKSTNISSVKGGKKSLTVKWKKQATQTTGYEIQCATDSKFTKNKKTVNISKNSTTSKKVTKLAGKKKYYVRVRTYKTVNGQKYYSGWSAIKTVNVKK